MKRLKRIGFRVSGQDGMNSPIVIVAALMASVVLPSVAYAQSAASDGTASTSRHDAEKIGAGDALLQKSTDADSAHVDDIIVTARFRKENVQKTPIAITALSGAQLEQHGFTSVEQVAQNVPNVVLQQGPGQGGKSLIAFIRGVGQSQFLFALQPGVGVYIDDVYQATAFGSMLDLIDLDRLEVLRGPQGTLSGRNSEGGAIKLYSQRPQGDNSGYVQVGYGNYNHFEIRGAFDVSLVPDKLFLRVSGAALKTDGYMTRFDFVCLHPDQAGTLAPLTQSQGCKLGTEGGGDVKSLRGALRWLPTNGLEVSVIADLIDDRGEPPANKLLQIDPDFPGSTLNLYNSEILMPRFGVAADGRFLTNSPYTSYATYQDPVSGVTASNPVNNNFEYGFTAIVDWDVSSAVHIKSVTGYRHASGTANQTLPLPVTPLGPQTTILYHRQFSQEINISSQLPILGRNFEWTVGGYYFDGLSKQTGFTVLSYLVPIFESSFNFQTNDPATDKNYSGFAHGIYRVSEKLSMEIGYRYTSEQRNYTFSRLLKPQDTYLFPVTYVSTENSRSDYRGGVQYQWAPEVMTYASISTGFKAGGFNPLPITVAQITSFAPETLTAYEIGAKAEFFGRKLRTNLALFRSDYNDLQQQAYTFDNDGVPAFQYINVGKARIQGIEFEATAEPTHGLQLSVSFGYLDYQTLDLGTAADVPNGPLKDASPPLMPKFTASAGIQYTLRGGFGSLTPRLDVSYRSRVYNDQRGTMDISQAGYALWNGHLTYAPPMSDWKISFEILNALNKVYYPLITDSRTADGIVDGQVGQPRMFKVLVRRNF